MDVKARSPGCLSEVAHTAFREGMEGDSWLKRKGNDLGSLTRYFR